MFIPLVKANTSQVKGKTIRLREMIHKHIEEYYVIAGYELIELKRNQHIISMFLMQAWEAEEVKNGQ